MIFSRVEFLKRTGIDQDTLRVWIEEQWLIPGSEGPGEEFSDADLARAELIRDLKRDMGVNDEGVGVILELLDQVHSLRKVLNETLVCLRETPPPSRD